MNLTATTDADQTSETPVSASLSEARRQATHTRHFRMLFEVSPIPTAVLSAHGRMVSCNPAFVRLLQRSGDELDRVRLAELVGDRHFMDHELFQREGCGPIVRNLTRAIDSPIEVRIDAVHLPEQQFLLHLQPVGDQKPPSPRKDSAEEELKELAYAISHDLRAPLRAISGFSHILLDEYGERLDEEGRRLASVIENNSKKLNSYIDDVLELSRLSRRELDPIELRLEPEFERAFAAAKTRFDRPDARLEMPGLPPIVGDPGLLRKVVEALVDNAVKFADPDRALVTRVLGTLDLGRLSVTVSDNGIGFAPGDASRAFRAFTRLHEAERFPGNGMGLAIVKRVISRHGGSVTATSAPAHGTQITFSLPHRGGTTENERP